MTINERIRELRKTKSMTQQDFADKIGLRKSAVSKMEQDGSTVTEQNRQIICEKFHISRKWLDDGVGEMKAPAKEPDIYDRMREKFALNPIEERILHLYFKLDKEDRASICSFMWNIGGAGKPEQTLLEFGKPAVPPVRHITQEERARRHAELDAEMDAEEKENSLISQNGNAATGTDDAYPF